MRYRARCEYDGTNFAGFQLQPAARTVQGELEAALARLAGGERVVVDGAGRTDAGVHALGQVIAFTYPGRVPGPELGRAVNALLPPDVAIRDLRRAPDGFHPRYAARYREYRYTVWNGPRSPLRERTALGVRSPLDVAAMASAGSVFVGRHDFSSFGGADDRSPVRTVHAVRVRKEGRLVTIDVRADAFLRGQVRRMVAGLLEVGLGKMDEAELAAALAARGTGPQRGSRSGEGALPPARGPRAAAGGRQGRRGMSAKTYTPRESEIERRWYVVDATDETLGRLATRIARILEGKNKPTYAAHLDTGDHVIVINAAKITVTRDKLDVEGLRPPQRLPAGLQGGDPRPPPRPPAGGAHPPRREGDAAAQPPGNPDAPEAQGLCGCRPPAPGPEARAARLIEEP